MLFNSRKTIPCILCAAVFLLTAAPSFAQQTAEAQPAILDSAPLKLDEIVSRMEQRNRERAAALRKYEGTRVYSMQYRGFFGNHDAQMVVSVTASPAEKQFTVESQSGSKFIVDHVLKKLLDGEQEAATDQARRRTALDSSNYDFTLVGLDRSASSPEYELNVIPRTDAKFLYRGKIWVDSTDFAVTRIQAEPARSPSMWIKKTEIHHKYEKLGEFWLPAENKTDSLIRFGGHALLSIEYRDYRIVDAAPLDASAAGTYERNPAGH
jgi:hypothetical protein